MPEKFSNTQDLVPIENIRDNAVVLKGGRLLKILMVSGVNFSLKSEEEQNIITMAYQNFLNSLDFPLQILIHSRKINIEKYIAGLEKRQSEEQSALLQNQIGEYREFIGSFVKENPIMAKTFLIVVPFSPISLPTTDSFLKFIPFLKKPDAAQVEKASVAKQENFTENLSQLDQRVNQVVEGIRTIGLEAIPLNDEGLLELFYNFYNPETTEKEDFSIPKEPTS